MMTAPKTVSTKYSLVLNLTISRAIDVMPAAGIATLTSPPIPLTRAHADRIVRQIQSCIAADRRNTVAL